MWLPPSNLLAAKIREGSSAVRRWFAQSNGTRRVIWVECGLVRDNDHPDKPNVFTVARRKDCALWKEGNRELARLAWLLAPDQPLSWQRSTKQTCRIRLAIGVVLLQRVKL